MSCLESWRKYLPSPGFKLLAPHYLSADQKVSHGHSFTGYDSRDLSREQRSFVGEPHFLAFVHSGHFGFVMKLLFEHTQKLIKITVSSMTQMLAGHLIASCLPL